MQTKNNLMVKVNHPLKDHNTFGLDSTAGGYLRLSTEGQLESLPELIASYDDFLILGGGSNVLLPDFYDGLVVHVDIQRLSHRMSGKDVLVNVGGGVNWHQLVSWAVENGFGGIENLALIPGRSGAAPIQNIGAYGVEFKDVFICLRAFNLETGKFEVYDREECQLAYRDSIFKNELKGKVIITDMWLRLSGRDHQFNLSYGGLKSHLEKKKIGHPEIEDIFQSVIEIRMSKLPDPTELGNAGSFFKNPVLPSRKAEALLNEYPEMPHYVLDDQNIKIPAGWLIEQCGFKGKYSGKVGCYEKQALVLINRGGAGAVDLVTHAGSVQKKVEDKFGILLEPEVNIIHPHLYDQVLKM